MSMERRYVPGTIYMVKTLCNAPYTTHLVAGELKKNEYEL